jgi:benzil reductase ((S)-benzoin forming)
LAGVVVWVSGGSSGIGRALIDTVPFGDARIIAISRSAHPEVHHVAADLSEPRGWEATARSFRDELEALDGAEDGEVARAVFIHAAATLTPIGFAGEVDPSRYGRQVLLNAASPMILGDAFIRATRAHGVEADVVVLTSGAATSIYEGWSAYGPAKAAVDHWVRTVGAERQRRGDRCRVLAVAPGVVATPMQAEIRDTAEADFPAVERFRGLHAEDELRDPEDAARRIWALLDEDHDNGAVLDVRDLD